MVHAFHCQYNVEFSLAIGFTYYIVLFRKNTYTIVMKMHAHRGFHQCTNTHRPKFRWYMWFATRVNWGTSLSLAHKGFNGRS